MSRNAAAIANACAAAGIETTLVLANGAGAFVGNVSEAVTIRSLLPARRNGKGLRVLDLVQSVRPLARYLRSERPDVLFSAGNHGHLAAIAAYGLAGRPGRLICRFSNDVVRPRVSRVDLRASIVEAVAARFLKTVLTYSDHVIAVSRELGDRIRTIFPSHHGKVAVIQNSIDLARLTGEAGVPDHPWFTDPSIPVVVGIGRLKAQKNFEGLVRAVGLANRSRPVRLVILGDGSPAARRRLESIAERMGMADRLWLAGYQKNPMAFLRHASLFVLSSRWEGAPNVLLEALASGAPIVSTQEACGAREILGDGQYGRLVPAGDDERMAAAILDRLDSSAAEPCRKAWLERFSVDAMLNSYVEAISGRAPVAAPVFEPVRISRAA